MWCLEPRRWGGPAGRPGVWVVTGALGTRQTSPGAESWCRRQREAGWRRATCPHPAVGTHSPQP